jgi:hypothetical protein
MAGPVQQQFLVAGQTMLVTGEHPLQGQGRGGRAQPHGSLRAVGLDVGRASLSQRPHELCITDHGFGMLLGASTSCQQSVMGLDDLGGCQPVEQAIDTADGGRRYHRPSPVA